MNRLKIFLITMTMVVVSCVTCFADSPGPRISISTTKHKYYINGFSTRVNRYYTYCFDSLETKLDDKGNEIIYLVGVSEYYSDNKEELGHSLAYYDKVTLDSTLSEIKEQVRTNNMHIFNSVDGISFELTDEGLGDDQPIPPIVAPITLEALMAELLGVLKILLPVSLAILCLTLSPSLIVRLISLFQ